MAEPLKIAIMGGTFDPVHYGHLVTAEAARCGFHLDKVIFVPSGRPPHKRERNISPAEHRLTMTRLAVATNPFFQVSRVEIDRPGFSYAIDTVNAFFDQYGPDTEIYFITGADAILEILTWKHVDRLVEKCRFIAATRPGFQLSDLQDLLHRFSGRIIFMEVPALAISSTNIRERVQKGRPIKYLLPETVEEYIFDNDLYCI